MLALGTVCVGEYIPVQTWTYLHVGKYIPMQKWNSPQGEQVHRTDAALAASDDHGWSSPL